VLCSNEGQSYTADCHYASYRLVRCCLSSCHAYRDLGDVIRRGPFVNYIGYGGRHYPERHYVTNAVHHRFNGLEAYMRFSGSPTFFNDDVVTSAAFR